MERSFEDLIKIDGIGEKSAKKIMDIVSEVVDFEGDEEGEEVAEGGEETAAPEGDGASGEQGGENAADETKSEE